MSDKAVAWLRAQVEARLAAAKAAAEGTDGRWEVAQDGVFSRLVPPGPYTAHARIAYGEGLEMTPPFGHITLNDPEDVMARCEAELAIIDAYDSRDSDTELMLGHSTLRQREWAGLHLALGLLASAYRHREGYEDHWGGQS